MGKDMTNTLQRKELRCDVNYSQQRHDSSTSRWITLPWSVSRIPPPLGNSCRQPAIVAEHVHKVVCITRLGFFGVTPGTTSRRQKSSSAWASSAHSLSMPPRYGTRIIKPKSMTLSWFSVVRHGSSVKIMDAKRVSYRASCTNSTDQLYKNVGKLRDSRYYATLSTNMLQLTLVICWRTQRTAPEAILLGVQLLSTYPPNKTYKYPLFPQND